MANIELAKAYIQIVPTAKGMKGIIQNEMNNEANDAGTSAGNSIVSKIKNVIAVAGIGKALSMAISEGAKLEQSIGGIETLFKSSANTMKQYANDAYKTAGISANSYMEQATSFSASLLSSLGGDTKKAAEAANNAIIDMADNSNKMGSNLQDIQNAYQGFAKQNYTMLDNLKLGYGGTKTEMQRLLADAQKITGVKYDISNLNDVYSAIHVIQDKLDITGTTSKEAATTLSGSFESMKSAAQNFIGYLALGQDITPSLNALVETASTFLFGNLMPAIGNIITALPEAVITIVTSATPILMEQAGKMINTLIDGIQNQSPQLLTSGTNAINNFITGAFNNLPSLLNTGGTMIIKLVDSILASLPSILNSAGKVLSTFVQGLVSNLPRLVTTAFQLILKFNVSLLKNLPAILQSGIKLIGEIAAGIIKGIPKMIASIPKVVSSVTKTFKETNWGDIGINIIKGIAEGIAGAVGSIVDAVKEAASSALEAAKDFLGIHSPSKVFESVVGKNISLGLAEGIEKNIKPVNDARGSLTNATIGMIETDFKVSSNMKSSSNDQNNDKLNSIVSLLNTIANKNDDKEIVVKVSDREVLRLLIDLGVKFV